jgi:hypothetical protein
VNRSRAVSLLGGVAIVAALIGASTACAATPIGDYQLQGTRASSGAGPALLDVGGSNSFQNDSVMGTSRQVLAFPLHSGVKMTPTGLGSSNPAYSIVTTFRLDAVDGFRRILDPSNGTDDDGFYNEDGKARYFGPALTGPTVVFVNDVYATVAITSLPSPATTKFYVNGSLQIDAPQTEPVVADTLRFFKDNDTSTTDEDSAGAVSCIRVYDGVLTSAEVEAIGASPTCGTITPPTTPAVPSKKCKKHKKKHKRSAESAKKKKCKKKKKKH